MLALDPATGTEVGRTKLAGAPERLVAAAAPDATGGRLYAVEGVPGPDERNLGLAAGPPTRWRLLALADGHQARVGGGRRGQLLPEQQILEHERVPVAEQHA